MLKTRILIATFSVAIIAKVVVYAHVYDVWKSHGTSKTNSLSQDQEKQKK